MKKTTPAGPTGLFLLVLLSAVPPVSGQVKNQAADTIPRFESIAPQPLPEEQPKQDTVKPPPSAKVTDDTQLVDKLKGLWFTANKEDILVAGRKEPAGITATGLPLLDAPEVRESLQAYLGAPVTLKRLNEMVKVVVAVYRAHDLPVVDVIVPEQDITTGVVQIVVEEGRVGEVRAEGNQWFSDRRILGPVRLDKGGRILSTSLVDDINFLNRNPFREVNAYFSPGATPRSTDVILKTKDRFPVRFYTGYEDTGSDITAEERLLLGFNWGNAFGLDHTLSYQYSTSPDLTTIRSHAVSYDLPVLRDNLFSAYFSFSQSDAQIPSAGVPGLETGGESMQSGFRYRHQLPGSGRDFQHFALAGLDQRQIFSDLSAGAVDIKRESTGVFQAVSGYELEWHDPTGGLTRAGVTGFFSPGDVGYHNDNASFQISRAFARSSYMYARPRIERRQPLFYEFEIQFRLQAQFSDANLLSTEQLGIGGYNTVRGYAESEIRGDQGWFSNLELYSPPVHLDRIFGWSNHPVQLRFLGFWDYGAVGNVRLLPQENPNGELSSVGGGVRLFADRYLSARMDYGFQLLDSGFNSRYNSRIHLGLILAY